MATTAASTMPRGRKRKEGFSKNGEKKFICQNDGCGRSFTRAEHLQRHLLNHSTGEFTCTRCRAHFKRRDLLDRHMARHRQKDQEAGADGQGILNTRKRMWKDAEGNIVAKKPALDPAVEKPAEPKLIQAQPQQEEALQSLSDLVHFSSHDNGAPISPLSHDPSLCHSTFDDHDSGIASGYPPTNLDVNALSGSDSLSPIDSQFWSSNVPQPEPEPLINLAFNDVPFDEIFNPDTASSFNNPFTTMNNYNWLFDMDLSEQTQMQPVLNDPFPPFQFNNTVSQPSHAFDLQLDHMVMDKPMSTVGHYGSGPSHRTDSPQHMSPQPTLITPPLTEATQLSRKTSEQGDGKEIHLANVFRNAPPRQQINTQPPADPERPMSMLQPSRCLPIIDELARAQMLDLIDIMQPTAPDGSLVMRDNPLLSLSCLQTYCDLFFTRFNTTYPLIHMSTFDPSSVDTLLLTSVLLLGATYGEKDAHQLAVCIHDVLRPQIFANAGFSAKPDLWVLQTILLVECFGKSRAGQKQHDMSHLFHGLLINLIRRSDCQSIRPPTLEDATDDLEDDWRTWVDAEQKKRLAFLCFMWDTQHAVLFCQSLCMSAFELRSNLPCDQSLWEADSAESWHHLRQKQPASPLFLSCLKMYLNPSAPISVPKNLNALSRALLLHGLMSIAWDMQRRDQTALGVIDTNPLGNWQSRLATSYMAWNHDFSAFCSSYLAHLPSASHPLAREFLAFRTALSSLYHAAHILLHTPFLDLQIYAGARHILGRPVARADYARSQKIVKKWVADNIKEAGKAVWHAAALVDQGVPVLDGEESSADLGGSRLWHVPWAVYLGTLTVWGVWYARPLPNPGPWEDDEDEIIWDPQAEMKALLKTVLKSEPERLLQAGYERGIAGGLGKRGTNGLAAVWRLVGGGGMFS
ncbi:hypothetical protein BU23DRAFT_538935 [Bimuria novae-zelandiae CBS 107.79]|uniref:C2H2-type domain-containing protein n=1 Tax=Bimuria novae-zelandiae CBS 107.79 TaxID=1447943 RepID=A0A6A5V4C8_9PLEO|nr:hypothetical protein BU23DRAFT_538935 [Bimuria novae-zelandiae CBS 107.79]